MNISEKNKDNLYTRPSPFVVGDIVSIRKWLVGVGERGKQYSVAGRVTKVWRSDMCLSGIMVRVRIGFFKWVDLDSTLIEII